MATLIRNAHKQQMNTLCYERLGLGVTFQVFLGRKRFSSGKPTISQEKDGFGKENQHFLRENKENKTKHLLESYAAKIQNYGFFGFPWEKVGFPTENHLFPRRKMVLGRKTNVFLGNKWFWHGKPIFS